ncbi:CCD69 protein, partial [Polypterus senegalus]
MVMLHFWAFVCGFCCLLELGNSRPDVVNKVNLNEEPPHWSDCGDDNLFVVNHLSFPRVITIPGPFTFSLKGYIKEEINSPIPGEVNILDATIKIPKPKIPEVKYAGDYSITIKLMSDSSGGEEKYVWGFWIEVPCVVHIVSCSYNKACEQLNHIFDKKCPFGLTLCQCPDRQTHGDPGQFWGQELESMVFVTEMKNERIQELNSKLIHMDNLILHKHLDKLKKLTQEHHLLQQTLEKESLSKQKLHCEKEELLYRLINGDATANCHLSSKKCSPLLA